MAERFDNARPDAAVPMVQPAVPVNDLDDRKMGQNGLDLGGIEVGKSDAKKALLRSKSSGPRGTASGASPRMTPAAVEIEEKAGGEVHARALIR